MKVFAIIFNSFSLLALGRGLEKRDVDAAGAEANLSTMVSLSGSTTPLASLATSKVLSRSKHLHSSSLTPNS
jgi:hypothetical protein